VAEDLRQRIAEAIRGAADYPIVAEWICCDPVKPDHDLCVQGDAARKMLRAVLADDPEVLFLPSGVVDAVMAVRDEELERLKVVETASIGAHALLDDAEEALARVRALAEHLKAEAGQGIKTSVLDSQIAAWKSSAHAADLLLAALDDTTEPENG
jgi:hypothetical protein